MRYFVFLFSIFAHAESVELIIDPHGIPHVFATTKEGAYFGAGYAAASDRMFQMDFNRKSVQGRLSEFYYSFGTSTDDINYNAGLFQHDFSMRVAGYSKHNELIAAQMPQPFRDYLEAYAQGVNQRIQEYLASGSLPSAYADVGATTIDPWLPSHSFDAWDRVALLFSGDNTVEEIDNVYRCDVLGTGCQPPVCAFPMDEAAASVPSPQSGFSALEFDLSRLGESQDWKSQDLDFKASHAWAVRGTHTTTRKAILAMDPKVQVGAPPLFHTVHLHAGDWDVRGAGPPGSPAMLLFWNKTRNGSIGQAVTASGGDTADLFEIIRGPGNTYLIDSNYEPIQVSFEEIHTKPGGPITTVGIENTFFGPIYDDVLRPKVGNRYPEGRSFAFRSAMLRSLDRHSVFASLKAMEASNFTTYQSAMNLWTNPTANAVLAFDSPRSRLGDIAYQYLGEIPWRVPNFKNGLDYRGRFPKLGTSRVEDWGPALLASERPHVLNPSQGYVLSGNNLVVGPWFDDFVYTGIRGIGDTFRSFTVRERLKSLLPTGSGQVSPMQVHDIHFDSGLKPIEIFHDVLTYAYSLGDLGLRIPLNVPAVTPAEKTQKVMLALAFWKSRGAQLKQSDGSAPLVSLLTSNLLSISRKPQHQALACVYNVAESGVTFMLKTFRQNPSATYSPEILALATEASARAWEMVLALGYSEDPSQWNPVGTVTPMTVYHQSSFFCSHPGPQDPYSCQLNPAAGFQVSLNSNYGSTLLSSGGSLMTSTIDFSNLNSSMSMVLPGSSEEPTSPFYNNMVPIWESTANGGTTELPFAPFDRNLIPVYSSQTLAY